jgi:hypothetical protein
MGFKRANAFRGGQAVQLKILGYALTAALHGLSQPIIKRHRFRSAARASFFF